MKGLGSDLRQLRTQKASSSNEKSLVFYLRNFQAVRDRNRTPSNIHLKCRCQWKMFSRLTSHFSQVPSPRLPVRIRYSLPVPSERVTQAEDAKCIDAQSRLSQAVKSAGSLNTSRGFFKAVSCKRETVKNH